MLSSNHSNKYRTSVLKDPHAGISKDQSNSKSGQVINKEKRQISILNNLQVDSEKDQGDKTSNQR